jgi:hypothetical protein
MDQDNLRQILRYKGKSETWLRSQGKIQGMLEVISKEESGEKVPSFTILGDYQFIPGSRHNCVTWCLKKLELVEAVFDRTKYSYQPRFLSPLDLIATTLRPYLLLPKAIDPLRESQEAEGSFNIRAN